MATATATSLRDLLLALDRPRHPEPMLGSWRWRVRRHLGHVRDLLQAEASGSVDERLSARDGRMLRERSALLDRLTILATLVLESGDPDTVELRLRRLVTDIEHHRQRLRDLAYDDVELEIGGSE